MKLMKRSNIYQASNYNVTFNPKTIEAHSYRWWRFVALVRGKVVFNSYRYSNSTSKHQSKVRSLMNQLGIKIDMLVQLPKGIEQGMNLTDIKAAHKAELKRQDEVNELKRIARNAKSKKRRLEKKLENHLENIVHFRDYDIVDRKLFGSSYHPISSKIAVHQCVDADSLEQDVENALYNFQRDGFGSVVFYV